MVIGIISDTHSLLREEAIKELHNCNLIIHAGDIGDLDIVKKLNKLKIFVIHDINKIKRNLYEEGINIVICGHSHKMNIFEKNGIIYINPGSIGRKRFKLPITMAKMYIEEEINNISGEFKKYILNDMNIYVESIELEC